MKKIFTLISMAFVAMSVNAGDLPENVYPVKEITWGDITWAPGNSLTDVTEGNHTFYILKGTGNAYKEVYVEDFEGETGHVTRPFYTYVFYWQGVTGVPGYGLYYKFTPKASGKLKVAIWANKGNRATTIVPASTGIPMVMHTDYLVEGYINGQKVKESDGVTNAKNADGKEILKFFSNDDIKKIHTEDFANPWGSLTEPDKDGNMPDKWNYVIAGGNQALWGWLTFDVTANESYYVFQASSQLGFGGYEFTPDGGTTEYYYPALGTTVADMADEFKNAVDESGKAKTTTEKGSVITFGSANMNVEAVGSSTPTSVVPDKSGTGIEAVMNVSEKSTNAPIYNLAGQKVNANAKGLLIQNGKKMIKK
jgi:hypothetical protein